MHWRRAGSPKCRRRILSSSNSPQTTPSTPRYAQSHAFLYTHRPLLCLQTWSYTRRWIYTFMIAHIAILVGQAGSINSAAAPYAATALGVSQEVVLLDTALFLVGFGVAAPIVAPLSEVAGRCVSFLCTLPSFPEPPARSAHSARSSRSSRSARSALTSLSRNIFRNFRLKFILLQQSGLHLHPPSFRHLRNRNRLHLHHLRTLHSPVLCRNGRSVTALQCRRIALRHVDAFAEVICLPCICREWIFGPMYRSRAGRIHRRAVQVLVDGHCLGDLVRFPLPFDLPLRPSFPSNTLLMRNGLQGSDSARDYSLVPPRDVRTRDPQDEGQGCVSLRPLLPRSPSDPSSTQPSARRPANLGTRRRSRS